MVDLNYNFKYDWLIELFNDKLSDNNLASEFVENRSFKTNRYRENCNFNGNDIFVGADGARFICLKTVRLRTTPPFE